MIDDENDLVAAKALWRVAVAVRIILAPLAGGPIAVAGVGGALCSTPRPTRVVALLWPPGLTGHDTAAALD